MQTGMYRRTSQMLSMYNIGLYLQMVQLQGSKLQYPSIWCARHLNRRRRQWYLATDKDSATRTHSVIDTVT